MVGVLRLELVLYGVHYPVGKDGQMEVSHHRLIVLVIDRTDVQIRFKTGKHSLDMSDYIIVRPNLLFCLSFERGLYNVFPISLRAE